MTRDQADYDDCVDFLRSVDHSSLFKAGHYDLKNFFSGDDIAESVDNFNFKKVPPGI